MQEQVVGSVQEGFGELLPAEDLERLNRMNERAKKTANRTSNKQFKQLARKNVKICETAELMGDGKGDEDGICEPGEWCEEVLGDNIGNDQQPCKLHGNKKEVCVEICDVTTTRPFTAPEDDENYADMEDPIDAEAVQDWEEMYDDVTAQLGDIDELLQEDGKYLAELAAGMAFSRDPAEACAFSIDWFKYGQILALTISKQVTVGARGVADIAERGCDQTVPPGVNFGGACIALEGIAAVTAVITETLDGILNLVEWGFQNGSQSCMSVLSEDLQTAKQELATIKIAATGSAADSAVLVTELGNHRSDFSNFRTDYVGHRTLMTLHDTDVRTDLNSMSGVLGDIRVEQDAAFNASIEEALRDSSCVPAIWLPAAQGGKLEYVRDHVTHLVQMAVESGDPTINAALAERHIRQANRAIGKGEYLNGCERLVQAVQALTK